MKIKNMVLTALFAALTLVATLLITIPSSTGYIHMGDAIVLLSAYLLGPINGCIAAGLGSALADVLGGFSAFAVPTLIIKALVAFISGYLHSKSKTHSFWMLVVFGALGEIFMVLGYFVTEIFLSGSIQTAAVGLYGSFMQAIFGIICSSLLYKALGKNPTVKKHLKNIS